MITYKEFAREEGMVFKNNPLFVKKAKKYRKPKNALKQAKKKGRCTVDNKNAVVKNYSLGCSFGLIKFPGHENEIPLIHDSGKPAPFLWKLPGGRIEEGESPEIAFYREINEELTIVVSPVLTLIHIGKGRNDVPLYFYSADYYNGTLTAGDGVEEVRFFTRAEVSAMIINRQIVHTHVEALEKITSFVLNR